MVGATFHVAPTIPVSFAPQPGQPSLLNMLLLLLLL
jgi:hypothetical protein